ncbi:glycosyltransferase [Flavobacterium sp. MC2016-06]|jgi:glycosyltransferase involved in cell wall biosynthesis|uniref:glycosyltransferase n=1 Tax=Flavobacterium sp. MC2016-06 TaxID=2676308 RepID=UPI0012BAB7E9|nr:glycosyltransferase [Flavobacterium sp. MC2016-06]MBU3858666.1 glycosyltransferase [Flavobacterium sp. MC2016-06]
MKILFVSMDSVHAARWIENLKDTNYELYWFDVLGKGRLETLDSVHQFTGWNKRKRPHIKGEYFLSKKAPSLYQNIVPYLEVTANEALEKIILEIQPDIVHSFEMQSCSYPILKTMLKYPKVKWLYSCWGNDLFYYMNFKEHKSKIIDVLKRVDFIHTDCERDFFLAENLGFKGLNLGVIPGGTGYKIEKLKEFRYPIEGRKIILVKGYQNIFGRSLNVIKALENLKEEIKNFEVIIFGAHQPVVDYISEKKISFKVFNRHELKHDELLDLMGKSLIYIGNNVSDGMPNTLLEAVIMGAFPIQSNPGGATAEIIQHGANGFLIENPEDVSAIQSLIISVAANFDLLKNAQELNYNIAELRLDYNFNKNKVIELYQKISD